MSWHDTRIDDSQIDSLPRLPKDDDGPVFAEPWQAQAFALAVQLAKQGEFTWAEWTEALGAQFSAAAERGKPDDGSQYFHHWLTALEQLVTEKQLAKADQLLKRKEAWIDAYHRTPHGQPVELEEHE